MREALDVGRPRRPGWYRKSKLGTAAAQRALQLDLPMTTVDSKDVATQPSVHPHALIGSAAANLPCVALHDTAAAARPCTRQILGNRKARATDEIRRGREPAVLGAEGCSAFPTARSSELDDQAVGLASILRCPGRPGAADQAVGGNDAVSDPISRYPAYLNPLPLRGSVPSPALGGEFLRHTSKVQLKYFMADCCDEQTGCRHTSWVKMTSVERCCTLCSHDTELFAMPREILRTKRQNKQPALIVRL